MQGVRRFILNGGCPPRALAKNGIPVSNPLSRFGWVSLDPGTGGVIQVLPDLGPVVGDLLTHQVSGSFKVQHLHSDCYDHIHHPYSCSIHHLISSVLVLVITHGLWLYGYFSKSASRPGRALDSEGGWLRPHTRIKVLNHRYAVYTLNSHHTKVFLPTMTIY